MGTDTMRYVALLGALDTQGEPSSMTHRKVLEWLSKCDTPTVDALCELIREARGRAAAKHRLLVVEVAEILDGPWHPTSSDEWAVVGLPIGLVRRIRQAAQDGPADPPSPPRPTGRTGVQP